jgi:hypothetical protein
MPRKNQALGGAEAGLSWAQCSLQTRKLSILSKATNALMPIIIRAMPSDHRQTFRLTFDRYSRMQL